MTPPDFSEVVDAICREDPRFERKAYYFLRQALDHTLKHLKKRSPEQFKQSNHVSGQDLLEGVRGFALEQFGPLAYTVLTDWNIRSTADIGEIVFNLIDKGIFSKTDSDTRGDFAECFDFEEAFVRPFEPKRRRLPTSRGKN